MFPRLYAVNKVLQAMIRVNHTERLSAPMQESKLKAFTRLNQLQIRSSRKHERERALTFTRDTSNRTVNYPIRALYCTLCTKLYQ